MKKLLLVMLAVFVATAAFAGNPWEKRLPFKGAKIDYVLTGTQKGKKTTIIGEYGRYSSEYSDTETKMFGIGKSKKELIITTPDWVYVIDLKKNKGTKQVNPVKYMIEEYNKLSSSEKRKVEKNAEKMGMAAVQGMKGTVRKNAKKILGYMTDEVKMMGVVSYSISGTGIPLLINSNLLGIKMDQKATKITKMSVGRSQFDVPAGVNISHDPQADAAAKAQAQNTIQMLLDGEFKAQPAAQPDYNSGGNQNDSNGNGGGNYKDKLKDLMNKFQ